MRKLGRLAAIAALTCLVPTAADAQARNLDAYASRLAVYRSGDFATALRASMALPFDRLRDDERFLDQAQESYQNLLDAGEGDPVELRLRLAHLTLREGNPEEALRRLDDAGNDLGARHRFVSLLLRGETLLWLDQVVEAEAAFEAAQAIHVGSLSAAAGLAAARQTRGDGRRAADAVRSFLSGTSGQDTWWYFLVQALADETGRLDQLRGLALQPEQ